MKKKYKQSISGIDWSLEKSGTTDCKSGQLEKPPE